MYRTKDTDEAFSITDNARLGRRRAYAAAWGKGLRVLAVSLVALPIAGLVLGWSGSAAAWAVLLLISFLLWRLGTAQLRDAHRLCEMWVHRERLQLGAGTDLTTIPWDAIVDARVGRGVASEWAGFLTVRFRQGGEVKTRLTVAPAREAAAWAVDEILRRRGLAIGTDVGASSGP